MISKPANISKPADSQLKKLLKPDGGQSTIEAAFLIPVVFAVLLLLLQPAILLYDRMVMESAAAQGLRMLATKPESNLSSAYTELIEGQLSAIPQIDIFHFGEWDVQIEGGDSSEVSKVAVSGKLKPLPLWSQLLSVASALDANGLFNLEVEVSAKTQPDWVLNQSGDPSAWISKWG